MEQQALRVEQGGRLRRLRRRRRGRRRQRSVVGEVSLRLVLVEAPVRLLLPLPLLLPQLPLLLPLLLLQLLRKVALSVLMVGGSFRLRRRRGRPRRPLLRRWRRRLLRRRRGA